MAQRHLNIKNLVPRKNSLYRQGYYQIINPFKYVGDINKIIYRSSYERRFAQHCDLTDSIVAWSSEPMQIPYFHPIDKVNRPYNVDFYVKVKRGEDVFENFLVEVKPSRQLIQPEYPKGKITEKRLKSYMEQMKIYVINSAKFQAAKIYADSRGWKFIVITEKFIL